MREQITIAQALGFAITITIVVLSAWMSMASRVAILETKTEVHDKSYDEIKEMDDRLRDIQIKQGKILQKLQTNND